MACLPPRQPDWSLGNIACRVGRTLRLDPATERIVDDSQADALLKRSYRADHWDVPAGA